MIEFVDRRGSGCEKWDALGKYFGRDDLLPFWVADMDFATPIEIQKILKQELSKKAFGYEEIDDEFFDSIISWYKKRHNTKVEREWIVPIPSVITALGVSIKLWGGKGVLVQPPVYGQFFKVIKVNRAKLVSNPLKKINNKYTLSYPLSKASLALFCSPQNPTGRVWEKEELKAFAKEASKQNMVVVSDEIHSDIIYNKTHYSFINFYEKSVVLSSINKSFNVAKFGGGYAIIPNKDLRVEFTRFLDSLHLSISPLSAKLTIAAYNQEPWLNGLLDLLQKNKEYINSNLNSKIKRVSPEGTYLFWLDFNAYLLSDRELRDKMINEAKLALSSGISFGKEGSGFMRFNFATSYELVKEGVDRINRVFKS